MARHGEMVGVARQLRQLFDEICNVSGPSTHRSGKLNKENDLVHLVNELLKKECCKEKSVGRFHLGFENFSYETSTSHPVQLRRRLEKHVKKRSRRLRLVNATY